MSRVILDLPDGAVRALHVPQELLGDELRLAAAMKLYEIGRLSSGAAAELAGIPRTVFLSKLGEYGVSAFDLSEAELRSDIAEAMKRRNRE